MYSIALLCVGIYIGVNSLEMYYASEQDNCPNYIKFQQDNSSYEGVYFPGETMCILMSNDERVQNTTYHEVCHHLIHEDKKHFCGGDNNGLPIKT